MVVTPPKPYCQIQIREKCMAGSPPKPYICLLFSGFSNVYHFPCFWLFCVSQFSSFPITHLVVISNLRHQIIIIIINIMTKLKTLSWVLILLYKLYLQFGLFLRKILLLLILKGRLKCSSRHFIFHRKCVSLEQSVSIQAIDCFLGSETILQSA